tara:strand:+ start:805 stop:987 length:183 start_codon:yes stop_codon:yes gene_type:complete
MKKIEILDKNNKVIDSFEEMTFKKAMKRIGNKYDARTVVLSHLNKHGRLANHVIRKGKLV